MWRFCLLSLVLLTACKASRPASGAAPQTSTAAGPCPADDPVPVAKPRPSGERPFVNLIPDEEVPLTRAKPDTETRFGDVTCKANSEVWRDAEGRVRVCTIAKKTLLYGIEIAADAYTYFWQDGRPNQTTLARPHELRTASGQTVSCAAEFAAFSKTGALEHCELAHATTFGKIPCRAKESVGFHHGGELALGVIDQALTLGHDAFPAGTRLYFYPSGALAGGWMRDAWKRDGLSLRWEFALHENGKLEAFELAEPAVIGGQKFPARAKVELRKDGTLRRAEYEVDSGFMPHGEQWIDTKYVSYDCAGKKLFEHTEHWQADFPPHPPRR